MCMKLLIQYVNAVLMYKEKIRNKDNILKLSFCDSDSLIASVIYGF